VALPPARWATLYAEEAYSTAQRKMGRQSAGEGLLDALIHSEPTSRFTVAAPRGLALDGLRERLRALRPDLGLHLWPLDKLDRLQAVDALYVADPLLARWAWKRQWAPAGSRAYSLVGVTHTLCTQAVGEGLRDLLSAPVQPWDAVICTSRSAKAAVQVVLEQEHTRLAERFGAGRRPPLPQLPLIPLGCPSQRLAAAAARRPEARRQLGLADHQFAALFVGRLELHGKAHPGVLLQALARFNAARQAAGAPQRVLLLVYGTAQSAGVASAWRQLQQAFAPHCEIRLLDGRNLPLGDLAWAAADVFVSLADSQQETFGLTPVEAMAAGLPVIATDWDGYRDTVRHGETGLLIPTLQPAPDRDLQPQADYLLGRLDYDSYLCRLMQQVVVDEDALLQALLQLADDPALRQRFGAAGQQRARLHYDWAVVAAAYRALAAELNAQRAAALAQPTTTAPPLPSPWRQFAQWPTATFPASGRFRCPDPARLQQRLALSRQLLAYNFAGDLAPPAPQLEAVVDAVLAGATSLEALGRHPLLRPLNLAERERAVAWLAKIGALAWEIEA
jgi:glycosyltransferase involved in cell wall biosynthesis